MNIPLTEKQFLKVADPFFTWVLTPLTLLILFYWVTTLELRNPTWEVFIGASIVIVICWVILLNIRYEWLGFKSESHNSQRVSEK